MKYAPRSFAVVIVCVLTAAGCTSDDNSSAPIPPEVTDHSEDWPLPGRDHLNSRAVPDSPITTETVDRLTETWSVPLPGGSVWGNAATTPLVIDDTVYVQDLLSNIRAIDRDTGDVRWTAEFDRPQIGPNGVAVGWGRVFAGTGGSEVSALDAETGEVEWSTDVAPDGTETVGIQPQLHDGSVLVSTVPVSPEDGPYVGGGRGVIFALDHVTGRVEWSFDTVDSDDIWGNPDVNSGGGVWFPPAVDTGTGSVFWGVGNPAPFAGTEDYPNGSSRPGPNLYTNSVVNLSSSSGEMSWYAQASPHDLFDHDLMLTVLVDIGEERRIVVGTGKAGRVIGHDPSDGEVLWDTPVGLHLNDDQVELSGPTEVLPGGFGGVISPPAASDGTVYVAVVNLPTIYEPDSTAYDPPELGVMPGAMVAVDATDGSVLWETPLDGDPMGGALVLADLVLTSTLDGTLYALDRSTGEIVWTHQAPGGVNGWPAAAGDQIFWPVGLGEDPVLLAFELNQTDG